MPKETFLKLQKEKQDKIIQSALDEFSLNDYNSSSLNKIITNANIPKGSMYQYFNNKKDLYLYILEYSADLKFKSLNTLEYDPNNFFEFMKNVIISGLEFDLNHPKISKLIINATQETSNDELKDISSNLRRMSDSYIEMFIVKAQKIGTLRNDISPSLIAFMISRIIISIADFIGIKYDFSYLDIIRNNQELPLSNNKLENIIDDVLKVIKAGIIKA